MGGLHTGEQEAVSAVEKWKKTSQAQRSGVDAGTREVAESKVTLLSGLGAMYNRNHDEERSSVWGTSRAENVQYSLDLEQNGEAGLEKEIRE